jgi:hypothetical protein
MQAVNEPIINIVFIQRIKRIVIFKQGVQEKTKHADSAALASRNIYEKAAQIRELIASSR